MTPIIATALALRAKIDETDPASFTKSISNVAISTVDGIFRTNIYALIDCIDKSYPPV